MKQFKFDATWKEIAYEIVTNAKVGFGGKAVENLIASIAAELNNAYMDGFNAGYGQGALEDNPPLIEERPDDYPQNQKP